MLVGVKLVVKIVFRKVKQVNLVIILKKEAKLITIVVIVVNQTLIIAKVIFVVVEIVSILLLVVVDENGINQDMMVTKMIPCPWTNTTIQEDVDQEKV